MHLLRVSVRHQRNSFRVKRGIGGDLLKTVLLRLPILIVGISGLDPALNLRVNLRQRNDSPRVFKRKRLQKQCVYAAENGRSRSHAERQR